MKLLIALTLACTTLLAAERKPNVIAFLVDDMGWMDCGTYGSKHYETTPSRPIRFPIGPRPETLSRP